MLATCKDGRAHLHAYLDDYAFLADALLELLQTRWRARDLEFARSTGRGDAGAVRGSGRRRDFISPPRITSGSSIAARPSATNPFPRATASRPACSAGWASARRASLSRRRRAHAARGLGGDARVPRQSHEPHRRAGGHLEAAADSHSARPARRRAGNMRSPRAMRPRAWYLPFRPTRPACRRPSRRSGRKGRRSAIFAPARAARRRSRGSRISSTRSTRNIE